MTEKELVAISASTMYATGSTAGTRPVFVHSVSGRERYQLVDTPASDRRIAAAATATMTGAVRPGARVSDLLRAAAAAVAAAGVDTPVGAVGGHGIGLELWERPLIKEHDDPREDVAPRPGMVLCLEPILAPPHPDGGLARHRRGHRRPRAAGAGGRATGRAVRGQPDRQMITAERARTWVPWDERITRRPLRVGLGPAL